MEENIKILRERINALELALANPKVTIDKKVFKLHIGTWEKILKGT